MPLKFEIKKKLCSRSERVKCVEIHPELTWILSSLYSGNISIYDYQSQSLVKTFEVSQSPVRAAKFLVRKQWIISGSDDLQIRVFNYNTMEKVSSFEAHNDYIRCIIVHPTLPYILSSADDNTIKMWDWDNNFKLLNTFEDHAHYVMQITLNPRDPNIMASGSLDTTIKIWNLQGGKKSLYTLKGHMSGINCVDYHKGDKPYLISGADDKLIKIWDYQTKQCVHTLEGHANNISTVSFHPELPIIMSGSEDGDLKIWHSFTYRLEADLAYSMDRLWSIDIGKESSNIIGLGFDEGTMVIKIGSDEPIVSMSNGKLVWAKNLDVFSANLKAVKTGENEIKDGDKIEINPKDLGQCDLYPLAIKHNQNGHVFALYNDSEYAIYRAQNFKNSGFGQGTDFVWASNGDYAVRTFNTIKTFKGNNNAQVGTLKPDFSVEELFGGPALGVRSTEFIIFYDWETLKVISKIDIQSKKIYWSENGNYLCIRAQDDFYVLEYKQQLVKENILDIGDYEGLEEAFELLYEIHENITSGCWINDIFFFTNIIGKLNYAINEKVFNYAHCDKRKFLIGYLQAQNRVYLIDKHFNISSYEVPTSVIKYQTAIMHKDFEQADRLLQNLPEVYIDKMAKFLDNLEMKEKAFEIVRDQDHKFELALQLNKIDEAFLLAQKERNSTKWKQVGDLCLLNGKMQMAIESFKESDDLQSLFLIYSSLGMKKNLEQLAQKSLEETKTNISFSCYFLLGDLDKCIEVLLKANRIPEACIFAKTYRPSKISELTQIWKDSLAKDHPLTSKKIANPFEYEDHYQDLNIAIQLEEFLQKFKEQQHDVPAHLYAEYNELLNQNIFNSLKNDENFNLNEVQLIPEINQENPSMSEVHLNEDNVKVSEENRE